MVNRRNYKLNSAIVLRDVYRLLSVVQADEPLVMATRSDTDEFAMLRDWFAEDEFVHLLIGTAVANRAQDDHMKSFRNDENELSFQTKTAQCGTLIRNYTDENSPTEELSFREACNKIIHAEKIMPELQQVKGAYTPFLLPEVTLYGEQNRREWKAVLDIHSYCRSSYINFQ